jgi:hypothetical protein
MPFDRGRAYRERRLAPFVWIGGVLLLLAGAGAYVVAGKSAGDADRRAAELVVEQARQDNVLIYGLVKTVPSPPSSINGAQDLPHAKGAVDQMASALRHAHGVVNSDLPRLRRAGATVQAQSGGLLVLSQRGPLDQERGRVDSVVTGFSVAGEFLQVAEDQMRFTSSMLDAEIALVGVVALVQQQNMAGALELYPQVEGKVQAAVALSGGRYIPPQMGTPTNTLATLAADFKQVLQAAQVKDLKTIQALQPQIGAEANALGQYDQQSLDSYETSLFKPYQERYRQALKQAGFTLAG